MGNESMLIIEAKDLAADKMSKGDHKGHHKKKKDDDEEMIEVSKVKEVLEGWDDKDHQYYKDVAELVDYKEDGKEEKKESFTEIEDDDF
jgi:hypothetical protein